MGVLTLRFGVAKKHECNNCESQGTHKRKGTLTFLPRVPRNVKARKGSLDR